MSNYRVLNPQGEVVATKDIGSANDAHAWLVDAKGGQDRAWLAEVNIDGDWRSFDQTDGDRR